MTPATALQILAVSAAIAGPVFTIFKWRACWVLFMVSNISAAALFVVSGLHILLIQYLIFIPLNVAGWIRWTKDRRKDETG